MLPGDDELIGSYVQVRLERTTGATFVGTAAVEPAMVGAP